MAFHDAIFQKHTVLDIFPLTLCKSERQTMIEQLETMIRSLDTCPDNGFKCRITGWLSTVIECLKQKHFEYKKLQGAIACYNKLVNRNQIFKLKIIRVITSPFDVEKFKTRGTETIDSCPVKIATLAGLSSISSIDVTSDLKEIIESQESVQELTPTASSYPLHRTGKKICWIINHGEEIIQTIKSLTQEDIYVDPKVTKNAYALKDNGDFCPNSFNKDVIHFKCKGIQPHKDCTKDLHCSCRGTQTQPCDAVIPVKTILGAINLGLQGSEHKQKRKDLKKYIINIITNKLYAAHSKLFYKCPHPDCKKHQQLQIANFKQRRKMLQNADVFCIACDTVHGADLHRVICYGCKHQGCQICECTEYHDGRACPGPRNDLDGLDAETVKLLFDGDAKRCPGCKQIISKIEGCDHMICVCGTHFCYRCNQKLDSVDPYFHTCPANLAGNVNGVYRDYHIPVQALFPALPPVVVAGMFPE